MWMRMSWNKQTKIYGIAKALTNEDTLLLFLWPLRVSRPFIEISLLILKHLKQQTLIQQFMSNHLISIILWIVNTVFLFFFVAFNKYIIIMCEVFHAHWGIRSEFVRIWINTFQHCVYGIGKKQKINPDFLTFYLLILISIAVKKCND